VPSLDALRHLDEAGAIELVAVVTQPDRPGHRGHVTAPPVKLRAIALGVPVRQPMKLGAEEAAAIIALRPDALVWAAYGNLIPRSLIGAASGRAVNVHASLLPRWRGAAPVQHAILAGDPDTGITLMEGTAELDAGPILAQERVAIGAAEAGGEVTARLARLGGDMLERVLPRYLGGDVRGLAQDASAVTWAPKISSADGLLDFEKPAEELARRVRAFAPEPGAFTTFRGQRIVVAKASVRGGSPAEHGFVKVQGGFPEIAAGAGWLRLDEVRPAGKRTMRGADWARGIRDLDRARVPS
jgi:methionyl-tRNA formyltransferase